MNNGQDCFEIFEKNIEKFITSKEGKDYVSANKGEIVNCSRDRSDVSRNGFFTVGTACSKELAAFSAQCSTQLVDVIQRCEEDIA